MQEIGHFPAFPQLFVEATEKLGQQEGGERTDLASSELLQIWNNGAVETGAQKSGKGVWVGPPVQA
ncbi:MAG TPA: hypothetical protein VJL90_02325 [Pseudorhodoplanes sp.]|nr:hypothetical protein [Pseudorhodoplanes sp.]